MKNCSGQAKRGAIENAQHVGGKWGKVIWLSVISVRNEGFNKGD